jgi:hypothetical protein
MEWLDQNGFRLNQDQKLLLKYRVIVHAGGARQAGIGDLFQQWNTSLGDAKTP